MKRKWTWWPKAEVARWPKEHKRCRVCLEVRPFAEFHLTKQCLFGLSNECKGCRRPGSRRCYANTSPRLLMFNAAKSRALRKGIDFDISVDDIAIPSLCPVFGVEMKRRTRFAPSLDRISASRGYVVGNVAVISLRANMLKNDATASELRTVAQWMETAA